MEIKHVDGTSVNTDQLGDVDALLLEESAKLYKLFVKYNRQVLLLGEMRASADATLDKSLGGSFFHLCKETDNQEIKNNKFFAYLNRIDGFVRMFTRNQFFITKSE